VFNNAEVREIARIIKALEDEAGYPIDVELALDAAGTICILQRRPITTNTLENTENAEVPPAKHGIAVLSGNVSGLTDKIADMKHPGNDDEIITFYRLKTGESNGKKTTVLIIDEKYGHLMNDSSFVVSLMERLNNDKVVNKRLNPSLLAKTKAVSFVPPYYDSAVRESILNSGGSIDGISKLLSAA
jgi:hypothetical protein